MPPTPEQEPTPTEGKLENFADIIKLHGMTPELAEQFNEQGYHVGYIKNSEGEIEYTIPLPNAKNKGRPSIEQFDPPPTSEITYSKRRPIKREGKRLLVYGDSQIAYRRIINPRTQEQELMPTHSEATLSVLYQLNAELRPDLRVNLSDTADMAELSRFDPKHDHYHKTLSHSMQRVHDHYAQLQADYKNADDVEVDSNHTERAYKAIMKNLPALHDFYRPGEERPLLTYYSMANLGALGVKFIGGYGGAEYVHGEEYGRPIVFKHGNTTSSTPGATVRKEADQNPETHVVRGHGHSQESIMRTTRNGDQLMYMMIGTTCLNDSTVEGYYSSVDDYNQIVKKQLNHQNTLLVIDDYENGHYSFDVINVIRGVAYYRGRKYDGNNI